MVCYIIIAVYYLEETIMEDKKGDRAVLILFFIPVVMAVGGLILKFNAVDFIYLLLVFVIFARYFIKTKRAK